MAIKRLNFKLTEPKGQSTVELAIVIPLLIIFLLAIIDFGRLFYHYLGISHAAKAGARVAALALQPNDVITKTVSSTIKNNVVSKIKTTAKYLNATDITVVPYTDANNNSSVTVSVAYNFKFVTGLSYVLRIFGHGGPGGSIQLKGKAVMLIESG